jgi:hypothetical protein
MTALQNPTPNTITCQVESAPDGYTVTGTFQSFIPFLNTSDELDHIEQSVEQIGQDLKRSLWQNVLPAADQQTADLFQQANSNLVKHDSRSFTIVTLAGEIHFSRRRLRNKTTGTYLIPSAVIWNTSRKRHITAALAEAACHTSQELSYHKSAADLAKKAGVDKLIATSTVWKKKQEKRKALQKEENDFIERVQKGEPVILTPDTASEDNDTTRHIEPDTIQLQADEVVTKSREPGKKTNRTYTATLETSEHQVFHFAAGSVEQLMRLVGAYLMVLQLYAGKKLEAVNDGASWIGTWLDTFTGVQVVRVLCWYHLGKRLREGLSQMGLGSKVHRAYEKQLRALLWHGRKAEAVWLLWDLRERSRNRKAIDDLMGYLLRKKKMLANYEERSKAGLWIASTRVEGWNERVVSARCKHKGMSWNGDGVLSIAIYAAHAKQSKFPNLTKNQTPL